MQGDGLGNIGQALGQTANFLERYGGVAVLDVALGQEGRPVDDDGVGVTGDHRVVEEFATVEVLAVVGNHGVRTVTGQDAFADQLVGVKLAGAGVGGDALVHQRLRDHRLVLFIVAELAEAVDVDHHVLLEFLAEFDGETGGEGDGFGVITIDMEDRRIGHLEYSRAEGRGAVVARVGGGEADLVVHHDMHGTARAVTARLRKVEHFLVDALAGDGGVTVDDHREYLFAALLAATELAGIGRTGNDRIDDFEVRGVEHQGEMAGAAGGHHVGGVAEVILHVTGREFLRLLAFEFVEEHRRGLAQGIDQHVETAPVGHADDHVVNTQATAHTHHFVEGDHQRFAAFEREAFLPDVTGVQVTFQRFGGGQAFEEAQFLRGGVGAAGVIRLDARLNPLALADAFQIHVFDADRAAIGFLDGIKNLAEGCALGNALEGTGVENGVDVGP